MDADQAVKLYPLILRMTADLVYLTNYLNQPSLGCLKKTNFCSKKDFLHQPEKTVFHALKNFLCLRFFRYVLSMALLFSVSKACINIEKDHAMKDKKRTEILLKVIKKVYDKNLDLKKIIDAPMVEVCT